MKLSLLCGTVMSGIISLGLASAAHAEDFKIGIIQSLTGSPAFIGQPLKDGMLLAIEHINEKGLAGEGNKIIATVEDDAGDRGQAISLLSRFASDQSMLMEVGPTTGAIAAAAAAAANDLKFPALIQSNVVAVAEAGPWSFMFSQPPDVIMPPFAEYAADKLGVKNCSVISILDNEAYVNLAKKFQAVVESKGVKIAGYEGVKLADIDFSALGVKLADSGIDCVFISAPAAMSANIIIQLRQAGLPDDVKILGHNAFSSPEFIKTGGSAVEGVYLYSEWVPGGVSDLEKEFAKSYEAKYGRPADNWAPQGYSQLLIVADALKRVGPNPTREKIRDALEASKDIPVVVGQGKFNWDDKRISHFGLYVMQVKDGEFIQAQ